MDYSKEMGSKTATFLWLVRILSLIGIGIMVYLTRLHFTGDGAVCEISDALSCETVSMSTYSQILDIPVAFLGLGYFVFVFLLSLQNIRNFWNLIFLVSVFAIIPSLYFSWIELFTIKSICVFCELSKVIMLLILGVSFKVLANEGGLPKKRTIFLSIALGVLAVAAALYLQFI